MEKKWVGIHGATHRVDTGNNGSTKNYELLWGDLCHVVDTNGDELEVHARGRQGWVEKSSLVDDDPKLLEIYVIDVGQGDGVLMKTPDDKWHLIDGGIAAEDQMTKKGAANFVRWKFYKDLRRRRVTLASIVMTHPDWDHYGGLIDVLQGKLLEGGGLPEREFNVDVEAFYHPGMARFAGDDPLGQTHAGTVDPFPHDQGLSRSGTFITELVNGKTDFRRPEREFTRDFARLAELVARVPGRVRAISADDQCLPGYATNGSNCAIRVLGPIVERFGSRSELRTLGSTSKSRNGHSVVLRVDYGNARVLLTGDLNTKSQQLLLSYTLEDEFRVDVAKGCHHGSDDIDIGFVRAMAARGTIISSGDNEDYAHPRPRVIGASSFYGRVGLAPNGETARAQYRDLERTSLGLDLVYGLVNVRTDGERILFATLEEKGTDFDKKMILAGRAPR